jgi:3-hydroxyacyl-[acyl-carrier-protein] dehydratase
MPGALMLEALEQASIIFIAYSLDFRAYARLTIVKNAKFRRIVRPGDQLRLEVTLESLADKIAKIGGRIMVDRKVMAGMDLKFAVVEDEDTQLTRTTAKLKALFDTLLPKTDSIFS